MARGTTTARVTAGNAITQPGKIISIPSGINVGLTSAKRSTMISILGLPRDTFDATCRGATKDPVKSLLVTQDVGPFRVTGIKPAVESLKSVLAQVKAHQRPVYDTLGTAGMFCARLIADSSNPSNHSWGCAVDISIIGALDGLAGTTFHDGKTLAGLAAMAPFFHAEGWFWGVGFNSKEDGMHFEVADETMRKWHAEGKFGAMSAGRTVGSTNLSIGDRGNEVKDLQRALARLGFDIIADGDFGPITHAIVMSFQASRGLEVDGVVGPNTRAALRL